MGVAYYSCSRCGEGFPDNCEEYISCEGCDNIFCWGCVDKYGIEWNEDDSDAPAKNCPVCNHKLVMDEDILEYCLKKLSKTKEQISEEIIKINKQNE